MKKWFISFMVLLLFVSGCSSQNQNANNNNNNDENDSKQVLSFVDDGTHYQVLIPFEQSDMRLYHGSIGREDRIEIGRRLQQMSTKHFDPQDYYISEGKVIDADLHDKLIKYASIYDEGLNPEREEVFETVTPGVSVTGPIIVTDVIELDFYDSTDVSAPVQGLAIAITLNKFTEQEDGSTLELSEETIMTWGESSARKLVSIIRSQAQMTNVPIFIGLYSLEKQDSSLPGGYISSAYFEGRSGQFVPSKEEWIIFPSTKANDLVNQVAVEFDLYKSSITSLIQSEVTGVIGRGRMIDGTLDNLQIQINTTGKTFLEIQALTQYSADLLSRFDTFDLDITVQVQIFDRVVSTASKANDESEATIVYY